MKNLKNKNTGPKKPAGKKGSRKPGEKREGAKNSPSGRENFDLYIQKKPKKQAKTSAKYKVRSKQKGKRTGALLTPKGKSEDVIMRLNRFIAMAGVCSRRQADDLIIGKKIKVNGKVVTDYTIRIDSSKDQVTYNNKVLQVNKFVYLLMNKPKDHITTLKDDKGRKTVLQIAEKYTKVRVYPVGRLDRNTTGILLLTNDGDLTEKLSHPSHQTSKIYNVTLFSEVIPEHIEQLRKGFDLEDGFIKADKIGYIEGAPFNQVAIEVHSGRNRIVRRMFNHLGYRVKALDRVQFGPLTKKNLPRGTCRLLEEREVGFLMMLK